MEDIFGILDSLNELEKKIYKACEEYMDLSDQEFLSVFPVCTGTQVKKDNGCLQLIGPPALPRKNNNCHSVTCQMRLWLRYFDLIGKVGKSQFPSGQRFKVIVAHHVKKDIFHVPNTVETHAYVNVLARILRIEDNLSVLDHEISVVVDSEKEECCEIRVVPVGFSHVDLEIVEQGDTIPKKKDNELYTRYQELLLEDERLRRKLSYSSILLYSPLRRRKTKSQKNYAVRLKEKGFYIMNIHNKDILCIASNSHFQSREEYASDVLFEFLIPFLDANAEKLKEHLEQEQGLILLQNSKYPDGDNIPFERIFGLLKHTYHLPLALKISIKYTPKASFGMAIILKNFQS